MKNNTFNKVFAVRGAVAYFTVTFFLLVCVLRLAVISEGKAELTPGVKIEIKNVRGRVLDRNMLPLYGSDTEIIAAVEPTSAAICAVETLLGEKSEETVEILKSGKCAVCTLPREIECDGIRTVKIPKRYGENGVAHHIVGYLDGDQNGVSGIEYAYNELLSPEKPLTANFAADGKGNLLLGVAPEFSGLDSAANAVVTTIDINIQKAAEFAAGDIVSGAVIIADAKTNKIRALVSKPDFSPEDINGALKADNSPLLNKALSAFSVGSVFKPCVAAAADDCGLSDITVNCAGNLNIENRLFNCHNRGGHGTVDLKGALKDSCNCYFYNMAISLGNSKLFSAAKRFDFGNKIKIGENMYSSAGNIPSKNELKSPSQMANFGIGQGSILISPVGMLTLYSSIANKGKYYLPSVIEKTVKDGKSTPYNIGLPTRGMKESTANRLKECLSEVLNSGTGKAAKSEKVTAAGKTATAQTGRFSENGTEINNSWFCGFFPLENPEYTVIVMSEKSNGKTPSEIFKEISEQLS